MHLSLKYRQRVAAMSVCTAVVLAAAAISGARAAGPFCTDSELMAAFGPKLQQISQLASAQGPAVCQPAREIRGIADEILAGTEGCPSGAPGIGDLRQSLFDLRSQAEGQIAGACG